MIVSAIEDEIKNKFHYLGFNTLTDIQEKAICAISKNSSCLLIAPTGSGKTEAAIIPVLSRLSYEKKNDGQIKVIYVTPLKALNNDVSRRIMRYAEHFSLTVEIRHGDTTQTAKKRINEAPPDILITTPESLAIILTNQKLLSSLKNLEWIIIDEIHEIISSKRGSHLTISLERMSVYSQDRSKRIGLSATLADYSAASKFLVGNDNQCEVLIDKSTRDYDIKLKTINGSMVTAAEKILEYIKTEKIEGSILIFTNTRDEAELLGTILKKQNEISVDVHHGSLSKGIREETELRLREGSSNIVVCTSSLELGIDIGSVALVIHYGSPRQVSKLMQRIGRSNHKQRTAARGLIIVNNPDDELEVLSILKRMELHSIEEQIIPQCPLDVIAHHIVGLSLEKKERISVEYAFNLFKKSFPFRTLTLSDIKDCLNFFRFNKILSVDDEDSFFTRRIKAYKYYYENLSTIPSVVKFDVIDIITNRKIGSLDQQFVGDLAEKNNIFVLRGNQWKILSIDETKMLVHVEQLFSNSINIPHWVGEMIPVDFKTAKIVGDLRQDHANGSLNLSSQTISEFNKSIGIIPDYNNIIIESIDAMNLIVIHATLGTKINNSLSLLLSAILSSHIGYNVETKSDPYRILITSNARIGKNLIENTLKDEFDLYSILLTAIYGTHNLNWKVWNISKKLGLISHDAIYDKKIAKLLYDRYSKSCIGKESIKEVLHDKFDIAGTERILESIRNGIIKIHHFKVDNFSKLSKPILEKSGRSSATPLNLEKGVIEMIKDRINKTKQRLICTRCASWEKILETKDIPDRIICPKCRSSLITCTYWSDHTLRSIISKKLEGKPLIKDENDRFNRYWKIASLINSFGKKAVIVLAGHGIGADTAARILRNLMNDDDIFTFIYNAEKQYVSTRSFWND